MCRVLVCPLPGQHVWCGTRDSAKLQPADLDTELGLPYRPCGHDRRLHHHGPPGGIPGLQEKRRMCHAVPGDQEWQGICTF